MYKILAILRSEDFGAAFQRSLSHEYDITLCHDQALGLELLLASPDILILDLLLPGMDGLSLLRKIHDLRPSCILMLTNLISNDILLTASDLGVNYIIRKPCFISDVVDILSRHCK